MNSRFGLHVFVPSLIINIRKFLRTIQCIIRIKIIIGKFDILIVKLRVFWEDIIDGSSTVTYKLLVCNELLHDGYHLLNLGVLDDFLAFLFFD